MSDAQKGYLIGLVLCGLVCALGSVDIYHQDCLYGFYCDGMYDPFLNSRCERGSCICSGDFVQTNCLPNVSNCAIQHGPTSQRHPSSVCTEISSTNICSHDYETYHCSDNTNPRYEVHVLSSYQASSCCSDIPETSRIQVIKEGQLGRKLVLVLSSSRPVAWYLDMEDDMEIERVVLVCKTGSLTTVLWSKGNVKEILKVSNVAENQDNLYGKGGDTINFLQYVGKEYGPVTSFTGRFQADQWRVRIGWPFKSDVPLVSTPSLYASRETSMPQPVASSIASPKHNIPTSTSPLYLNTPEHTLEFSSPVINDRHSSSYISASHQTPLFSSIITYPPVSQVSSSVPENPEILPSTLTFFHAFGTLEFHHISGLDYYANGTLKVRAPVVTQLLNSTSEINQSIEPTSSFNNQISSTRNPHQTIPPSPSFTQISSTLVQSSKKTPAGVSSSKLGEDKITSTFLDTSTLSSVHTASSLVLSASSSVYTSSSLVPAAVTSSVPRLITSTAVVTPPVSCTSNPCHKYASCLDTLQGASCTCNKGFNGDGFQCDDKDECLLGPCPTNSKCQNTPGSYNCTCLQEGSCRDTRIIGGQQYSGRVEVLNNGEWGTICAVEWDSNDAQVACRDAGYPHLAGVSFAVGFGKIWLSNVKCNGSETRLADCPHPGWGNVNRLCTHVYDVGVECVPLTIRLAGSGKPDEGRIEIYFDGEWGTICNNSWDIDDAEIACTELGFEGAERVLTSNEVQDGTGRVWLDNVECTGVLESFINECSHSGWGNVKCGHDRDAGVKCKPKVSCDFELNTCSWRHEKQTDNFDWQRHRASTPTLLTGPKYDNTKKTVFGVYMYIETTGRKPGDKAWLVSPTLQPKHGECMQFHYYMLGTDIRQLNVNIRETGTTNITRLWNLGGSRKDKWVEASVPLNFDRPSEIIFEAVSGDDQKGDIAIDDVIIVQSPCTVYPDVASPDVDECFAKPCHVNATCSNTIGSYHCKCNEGYTGNGTVCADFDECATNPCHMNATCTNTNGGFSCECNPNTEGICDDAYRPCGLRQIFRQTESKIIGGSAAKKGSWPWIAAIFYAKKMERIWCGGVLINNEWVLTAAHCFDENQSEDEYTVVLGEHDILTAESDEQRFKVDSILIHPAYSPLRKNFDIAMIHLQTPANYTANILPICLLENELPAGTKCLIAGWGTRTTDVKDYPQFLQEAVVPIIDQPTCQALYSFFTISLDMVCAGYTTGTIDACQGDSGGPLMCQQGDRWYLAGLTSFGFDCAAKGYPGVYSNVAALRHWVNSQIIFFDL